MSGTLKHAFVSAKSDPGDSTLIKPSDWNAAHMGGPKEKLWVPGSNTYGLDDEFDDASLDAAWVKVNTARVTWTEGNDVLSVLNTNGDAAGEIHAIVRPLGSLTPPVTIETAQRYFTPYAYPYLMLGPIFTDGTTNGAGKQIWAMPYTRNDIALSAIISMRTFTNFIGGSDLGDAAWQWTGPALYSRLIWVSANTFTMQLSPDGVSWISFYANSSYAMTPTHAGLASSTWGGGTSCIGSFDYFRVF